MFSGRTCPAAVRFYLTWSVLNPDSSDGKLTLPCATTSCSQTTAKARAVCGTAFAFYFLIARSNVSYVRFTCQHPTDGARIIWQQRPYACRETTAPAEFNFMNYLLKTFSRLGLWLALALVPTVAVQAQNIAVTPLTPPATATPDFYLRLAKQPVTGGAELLTVFGKIKEADGSISEVPLLSVVRDTLGDNVPENDRLRYVWLMSYGRPSLMQNVAAAVPFLYKRVGNNTSAPRDSKPPALMDLNSPRNNFLRNVLWYSLQNLLVDPLSVTARASFRTYRRNRAEYRQAQIARALAALYLYEKETGTASVFTPLEMRDMQAKLILSENTLGGLVDESYYREAQHKRAINLEDARGHNWELLRQRAEAEGLYFEPLTMPDGTPTHALLWVAAEDLPKNTARRWDGRFLNIANPWTDKGLRDWRGYRETRYFDADNRTVPAETPNARAVEMYPLAVYGLDNPKIPALLIDFRDQLNAKKRELSRRLLEDVSRNILQLSASVFGDLPYFVGRSTYDFVTGRRGTDINQPSRFRTYAQLKLLLSLSASLDPALEKEITQRLERVSSNPLENDAQAEVHLARAQYAALLNYATRPDGLAAQLALDRRAEAVPLKHGKVAQIAFQVLNTLTFGNYLHREKMTPELLAKLDMNRRFDFHTRFLREVVKSTPRVEVVWRIEDVRRAVQFITENNEFAGKSTSQTIAAVFRRTDDAPTQNLCLASLYRINNETAKAELLKIYRNSDENTAVRAVSADYLRDALRNAQRIAPADAKAIIREVGR